MGINLSCVRISNGGVQYFCVTMQISNKMKVNFSETAWQNVQAQMVAQVFRQGAALLSELRDDLFAGAESAPPTNGTVGQHFRHCLEFATCFLTGLPDRKINYHNRARDLRTEIERPYCRWQFLTNARVFAAFPATWQDNRLLVKPELVGVPGAAALWCQSSIERELDFIQSHTIHHYALIAAKLRAAGFPVPTEFGVAPSTLAYWQTATEKA